MLSCWITLTSLFSDGTKSPRVVRIVRGTKGTKNPTMVRKIHGTKRPRYEKSTYGTKRLWYEKSGSLTKTVLHHLIGLGIILQKPSVCYIMPVGVHTPLRKYPSGDWQLLSRSRVSLERENSEAQWITSKFNHTSSVSSVSAVLHQLYLEPLEERRRINRLTFLYKVLHEHVAVSPDHLDLMLADRLIRGTVTKQRLKILRCSTTLFQKSFVPRTITQWNTLPALTLSVNLIRITDGSDLKDDRKDDGSERPG